jgi:polysaccharide biosynthesis transport protein
MLPMLGTVAAFRSAATNLVSHPALRFLAAPTSVEAENYRSIRAALSVVTDMHKAKVLQITSSEPGDGKTTTAANIALAFAQSGHRVLLVDADLRRPTVHKLFAAPQERGLSELIAGEITFAEAVRPTTVSSLSLITAGSAPLNPSELVASERFGHLVEEFRGQYDYVLIDTPPMLAVSDPCIISKYSDGVLLVVRIHKNRRAVLRRAVDLGNSHNARWLGVVVNGLSLHGSDGYGYYYYYEYTGMTPGQQATRPAAPVNAPTRELSRT